MAGTVITAFVLIETLGFTHTLWIAGASNFLIAIASFVIGRRARKSLSGKELRPLLNESTNRRSNSMTQLILFTTGFTSLALEVVWTRSYMPVLGTQVYAFALLLFVYLLATRVGSVRYRTHLESGRNWSIPRLLALLSIAALLLLVMNDPQITRKALQLSTEMLTLVIMFSIFPFCALLGYLTPYLVDTYAEGNPRQAGQAYAMNIIGCVIGPLVASYLLLPQLGAKNSMIVLALPFLAFFALNFGALKGAWRWMVGPLTVLLLAASIFYHRSYEDPEGSSSESYVIRRDHTATVTSLGEGMAKRLYINGVGITYLTPITKFMAHLPLVFVNDTPESALVICFGMGTTYRSLLSWDIRVTSVELVPSVKETFPYYFDDAKELNAKPKRPDHDRRRPPVFSNERSRGLMSLRSMRHRR
jgi:spermidine synthase